MMSEYLLITFGCVFCLLTFVGVFGNLVVIVAISGDRKMRRSIMNILLLNLAVADASNLLLTICEWIPTLTDSKRVWLLPAFLCAICRYLECVFLFCSISTQLIVCIERYIAIVHPMKARVLCTRQNVLLAVVAAWSFAAMFAMPYAKFHYVSTRGICSNEAYYFSWWPYYKLAEFLLFYLFPCLAIICVYSRVAFALWASNPQLIEVSQTLKQPQRSETLRTRRNVVKMLIACGAVYFVCYSPIQMLFISNYLLKLDFNPPYALRLFMNALTMTCSASNPLLYTLFSLKFRRRLASLLSCSGPTVSKTQPEKDTKESRLVVFSNLISTGTSI